MTGTTRPTERPYASTLVTNDRLVNFTAKYLPAGDPLSKNPKTDSIELYDRAHNLEQGGQFVSAYRVDTMLAADPKRGIDLMGGVDDWYISAQNVQEIQRFLEVAPILDKAFANLDETYELVYTGNDEALDDKQIAVLLAGQNPYESSEFTFMDDAVGDQIYDAAMEAIKGLLTEEEFDTLDLHDDERDELRWAIQDRDRSNPIEDMLANAGSKLVRYDLDVPVNTDWNSTEGDRRDQALAILEALGVTFKDALLPDEALIKQVTDILIESGQGNAWVFWYTDVQDLINAARPQGEALSGASITFENVHLLVLDSLNGAGYDSRITGTFTVPFDAERLTLDSQGFGYGWNDVASVVEQSYGDTEYTITPATEPAITEEVSQ